MKEGRAIILILRSIKKRGLQESTDERIFQHLLNIARNEAPGGQATEKRAEELIRIIEDERNTEADILTKLKELEKPQATESDILKKATEISEA